MEIIEGIFQVHVPVPFPLKYVNCYLVRDDDGWTMLDTGLQYEPAHVAWNRAFDELKIGARDIRRIFLTHAHPDHYGLAGHFQNLSNAPVYLLNEEIRVVPIEWQRDGEHMFELGRYFARHGMPPEQVEIAVKRALQVLHMLEPQPKLSPLYEGEEIAVGGKMYRVIWTPGHADGHAVFYGLEDHLLFAGDHVLLKITPNIPLWPGLDQDPLHHYLDSLEKIRDLKVKMVLPGHRATFEDLRGRINELRAHHQERAIQCERAAGEGRSAYEICLRVFPDISSADEIRLAMVEILAHLEYLVIEGRLEKLEGNPVLYRKLEVGNWVLDIDQEIGSN